MGLETYRHKRDFRRSPEPRGKAVSKPNGRIFVVQKHAARRLHYDFRLELNGVLLSWAVPKGPSLNPKERRLAVRVEDHPLEYGHFEGKIPEGQYGAGSVLLWDRGHWMPVGDPLSGLRKGKLKFRLEGKKLSGGWTLVRMGGRAPGNGKENWLLIKEDDDAAGSSTGPDILEKHPESIKSGRAIEEIGARDREWRSHHERKTEHVAPSGLSRLSGARKSEIPERIQPQLATLVSDVPKGNDWLHEIKFDGYRALCRIEQGRVGFFTREGKDWTSRFGVLAKAAAKLQLRQALLDGEVVVMEPNGTTNFQALQNALNEDQSSRLVYCAFDLLHSDGYDLTQVPLLARKETLARILKAAGKHGLIRFSDHILGHGETFYQNACQLSLEGIISKRKDRPYQPGRGRDWVKVKCLKSQEFVIGGFTDPSGSRAGLGALLLGVHENGDLLYAGRVGTGFTMQTLKNLRARLNPIVQKAPPFSNPPVGRGTHWVKPKLVAEVEFTEWTRDGLLRHPSFRGLREDKPAAKITRERPQSITPATPAPTHNNDGIKVAGISLTHPDRVLYPEIGITKRELALFYEEIAEWILPHLRGRPLTLVRCPEGHKKECFYQKHANKTLAEPIRRLSLREGNSMATYVAVDSLSGLISLVQMGVLELHTWGSRSDQVERPDRLTFDLDPDPTLPWKQLIEAAQKVRTRLSDLGLAAFVKTTGGKGLHVVVPLARKHDWGEVKGFSKMVAESIVRESPERYTATMSKAKRKGKVFIDYLRNVRGATTVAAYSTRALSGAPVSVPLRWEELGPGLRSDHFTVRNLSQRLARQRQDPWEGYEAARRPITAAMRKELGRRDNDGS